MPRSYPPEARKRARELYLEYNGARFDLIEQEMRRDWPQWSQQLLFSRGKPGTKNYRKGWIEAGGWKATLELQLRVAQTQSAEGLAGVLLDVDVQRQRLGATLAALGDDAPRDLVYQHQAYCELYLKTQARLDKEKEQAAEAQAQEARAAAAGDAPEIPDFPAWLPAVSPKYTWDWPHLRYLYERLANITSGASDRLMIFMPPRHGKSTVTTIHYAAWRIVRDPATRIIIGAYSQKLANKFSRDIRRKVIAQGVTLSEDNNSVPEWETWAGGGVLAVGRGGGVTGFGADLILLDDTVKNRAEAESETYQEKTWDWYGADIYTRQEPNCAIILTNTRWHEADLSGRLIDEQGEGGDQWEVVSLPALAEANDPLGREIGEPLCPARKDKAALERMKAKMKAYDFSALYQQQPIPNENAVFKVDWFTVKDRAPEGLRWVRYYDLAASAKTSADYTASLAAAFDKEGNLWFRDMLRGRWEWPEAKREIKKLMLRERHTIHGFESVAFQLIAVQELRRERTLLNIPFRAVKVTTDKLSRALPLAERAAEGKVFLVRGAWVNAFLSELARFTGRNDAHDDQVDTASGCVEMLAKGGRGRVATA